MIHSQLFVCTYRRALELYLCHIVGANLEKLSSDALTLQPVGRLARARRARTEENFEL
jgi:hypothetical protein